MELENIKFVEELKVPFSSLSHCGVIRAERQLRRQRLRDPEWPGQQDQRPGEPAHGGLSIVAQAWFAVLHSVGRVSSCHPSHPFAEIR
jgi:hypothetical protein